MAYPVVKFQQNATKDKFVLNAFLKDARYDDGGKNLDWAIFAKYPNLRRFFVFGDNIRIKNKKAVLEFINKEYQRESAHIKASLSDTERRWNKVSPIFFSLIEEIFGTQKWPNGKYIAYSTIWGMYPRFLNDKTFCVPFRRKSPNYILVVIAHELLHFMFYDYFYRKFSKYKRPKYNYFVWQVSEIFNTIVQNSSKWVKCFGLKSFGYPEHKKVVSCLVKVYRKLDQHNVDALVNDIMNIVR